MCVKHWRVVRFAGALAGVLAVAASLWAGPAPTGLLCQLLAHPEETTITDPTPKFGWIYAPAFPGDAQHGYRILVATTPELITRQKPDAWDSGIVTNAASINVHYRGVALRPGADYFWRVQTVDSRERRSPFSAMQHFRTDSQLADPSAHGELIYGASTNAWANRYPLQFVPTPPVLIRNTGPGRWFVDFGQDAFGYVTLNLASVTNGQPIEARFGERANGMAVDTAPPGSVRYGATNFTVTNREELFSLRPPDISGRGVDIRPVAGVVMPFRYFELTNWSGLLTAADVTQQRLQYAFNDDAALFSSSSPELNRVWELCRYSIKATSFAGVYVDGDRERKPYEADAFINQLGQYALDREFTLARYTQEYLLAHPTWPTEWKFHSIFMAWADYLETGDDELLARHYDALVKKLFLDRARIDGLMQGFPNEPQTVNSDIVDWPPSERDGFVIAGNHCNSVNSAFYYHSLRIMADAAALLGRTNDAAEFTQRAERVYAAYNRVFWDAEAQTYRDGDGINHASAHANFFPLAFGLVPATNEAAVLKFLHTRGMAPSVYGAQYLLEALFQSGDADYALSLMTTNGPRGWLNMLNIGSSITTEAWDFKFKPNMDWNHAWGAAPANIISRFVLGVRPLEAGYGRILIQPQLGHALDWVDGTVPTIRGPVLIRADNPGQGFRLTVTIPGNVSAKVMLPAGEGASLAATIDGKSQAVTVADGWATFPDVGSGWHVFEIKGKDPKGK